MSEEELNTLVEEARRAGEQRMAEIARRDARKDVGATLLHILDRLDRIDEKLYTLIKNEG